jgi:hypothetical protein
MTIRQTSLALKPYLEAVEQLCNTLSKKQLSDLVLNLAADIPARERAQYLDILHRVSKTKRNTVQNINLNEQIAGLIDDIRERIESIDSGEYWDDDDEYDSWGDNEPSLLSEEQKELFQELLTETDQLFLAGNLSDAQQAYSALFSLFTGTDMADVDESAVDVDLRETRARYCRCVYETAPETKRVENFASAMIIDDGNDDDGGIDSLSLPMFADIIGARREKMKALDTFLSQWKKVLEKRTSSRAAKLLIEATLLYDGSEIAARITQKLSKKHPSVYPVFISLLQEQNNWKDSITISRLALKNLAPGHERARVAVLLRKTAEKQNDSQLMLVARREEFFSYPEDASLCRLLKEVGKEKWQQELTGVIRYLDTLKGKDIPPGLRIKVLLMAGRLDEAFEEGSRGKAIGWSYADSGTGLLYSAVLYALTPVTKDEPSVIKRIIDRYAQERYPMGFMDEYEFGMENFSDIVQHTKGLFSEAICMAMRKVSLNDESRRKYRNWAKKKADARITHIVSNKHRRAYERAAEVLIALAEYYVLRENFGAAQGLIAEYMNCYNRHTAFKSEVKAMMKKSPVSILGM